MGATQQQRHKLFTKAEAVFGPEEAATFMEVVLPVNIEDLATKADLEHLRLATKSDIEQLRLATKSDIEQLRLATKADLEHLHLATKSDIEQLRLATKADIDHLRHTSKADLDGAVDRLRSEMFRETRLIILGVIGANATMIGGAVALAQLR